MMTTVLIGLNGGVGTTAAAASLARQQAATGGGCVAVDLDRWCGDLALRLGVSVEGGAIASLASIDVVDDIGSAAIDAVTWRSPHGVDVIASPAQPELAELVEDGIVVALMEALRASQAIVVDAGSRLDSVAFRACEHAHRIVLVGRADESSERQAHVLVELLRRAGIGAVIQLALPSSPGAVRAMAARVGIPRAPDVGRSGFIRGFGQMLAGIRDAHRIASMDPRGAS